MAACRPSARECLGIGSAIVSTAHAFRQALECELSKRGVTFRQWEVLALIRSEGEQPQSNLAEKMGLEAQTLAGIISRMERDGWLTRESCAADRRRKLMRLTKKAEQVWSALQQCCEVVREQASEGLDPALLHEFEALCRRMQKNLARPCDDKTIPEGNVEGSKIKDPVKDPSLEDTHIDFDQTAAPTIRPKTRKN